MNPIHPKKRLGQHFLSDRNIARKIVAAAQSEAPRLIIEIGPGKGVLTDLLVTSGEPYVGVEIDSRLARWLRERFGKLAHFHLLEQDFLTLDLRELIARFPDHLPVVVGNIPYNITSPILFKLFEDADRLHLAVLMVQKEVGERMIARPSTKAYGLLAIYSQLFAEVELLFRVPAKLFRPPPKVDSAVMRLRFRPDVRESFTDFALFEKVLHHCFGQRRKMLRKSLSALFSPDLLRKLGVDLTRRPEALTIPEWKALTETIAKLRREEAGA